MRCLGSLLSVRHYLHFDGVADTYGAARPPYPSALYDLLTERQVIGAGRQVLEIGAGTGGATRELLDRGCEVWAVEPGPALANRLRAACPEATVIEDRVEYAELPAAPVSSVVAAAALHWADLGVALPRLHAALRPAGQLAVWRTIFGDPRVDTPFWRRVHDIVAARAGSPAVVGGDPLDPRPTVAELTAGGFFRHRGTWEWAWPIDLDSHQVRRLFETFSDWSPAELDAVEDATRAQGGAVRERYVTLLHLCTAM